MQALRFMLTSSQSSCARSLRGSACTVLPKAFHHKAAAHLYQKIQLQDRLQRAAVSDSFQRQSLATAATLNLAATEYPTDENSTEQAYNYVRKASKSTWGVQICIPKAIYPDGETRQSLRYTKAGFETSREAALTADEIRMALFVTTKDQRVLSRLNFPGAKHNPATIKNWARVLRAKYPGIKLKPDSEYPSS